MATILDLAQKPSQGPTGMHVGSWYALASDDVGALKKINLVNS